MVAGCGAAHRRAAAFGTHGCRGSRRDLAARRDGASGTPICRKSARDPQFGALLIGTHTWVNHLRGPQDVARGPPDGIPPAWYRSTLEGIQLFSALLPAQPLVNPFPATGESFFRVWPSSLSVLARNPIKFGHFQPLSCGFLDCIPEIRDPTVLHLACSPRFARAAP
eukprot:scaffold37558_cov48-Phaeocystis_antarctica.AAC.1